MNKLYIAILLPSLIATVLSCGENPAPSSINENPKKAFYEKLMKTKNFKLEKMDDCSSADVEANTFHVDWVMNDRKGKVIQFRLAAPCQM
ncbi:MAG: hypothetical protein NXI10_09170 [bacterium]|nr:hypothetical protein [bacterium]